MYITYKDPLGPICPRAMPIIPPVAGTPKMYVSSLHSYFPKFICLWKKINIKALIATMLTISV